MREKSVQLLQGGFTLDIRNNFFSERFVKHCNRMPRAVGQALSLEIFKGRVDVVLRDMAEG